MDSSSGALREDDESGSNKLSTVKIVVIAVGCFLGLLLFLVVVIWLWCRHRHKPHDEVDDKFPSEIKIQTLGNHYKIASIQSVHGGITPDRKFSLSSDRKFSEASHYEHEALLQSGMGAINEGAEDLLKRSMQDEIVPQEADELRQSVTDSNPNLDAICENLLSVPSGPDHGPRQGRNRSDSTYLDFNAPASRKCSTSSHLFSMQEIEKRTKEHIEPPLVQAKKNAPMAKHESLHSLKASKESLNASRPGLQTMQVVDDRRRSECQAERNKFIPKLPPKKKRFIHHKSAADIIQDKQELNAFLTEQSIAASKSENCLLGNGLDDYDDLPEQSMLPLLPPKTKPSLPPKQKINKSQDDLARIETELKSSLSELRKDDRDLDYDDLPLSDEEVASSSSVPKRKRDNSRSLSNSKGHEYEDYDEPTVHVVADHEQEDYDDPISHVHRH